MDAGDMWLGEGLVLGVGERRVDEELVLGLGDVRVGEGLAGRGDVRVDDGVVTTGGGVLVEEDGSFAGGVAAGATSRVPSSRGSAESPMC